METNRKSLWNNVKISFKCVHWSYRGYICVKMWFIHVAVCYILLCRTLSIQLISFKAHSHIFFPWYICTHYIVYNQLILTQSPINQEFIFWYMSFNFNHEEPNCNWSNWQVGTLFTKGWKWLSFSHFFFSSWIYSLIYLF